MESKRLFISTHNCYTKCFICYMKLHMHISVNISKIKKYIDIHIHHI